MIKLVCINHSFQKEYYSRRWKLFAQQFQDVDVTLLTPKEFSWYKNKIYTYGNAEIDKAKDVDEDNFHIRTFRINFFKVGLTSPDFKRLLLEIHPDVIYNIGSHTMLTVVQIGEIARKYLPKAKLVQFSMRGPNWNQKHHLPFMSKAWLRNRYLYYYSKPVIKYLNKHYDAITCHYPDAVEAFRREGFEGPIYMQTQVGVNKEWFYENEDYRKEIREKYHLGDAYVFGSASRFTPDKGLDDIIDAMPKDGNWKFLMMGKGGDEDMKRIKNHIQARGLQDKIILTGFIDWFEIVKYWNAIDCAIHVPRTTEHWVETFSLTIIQAMLLKKPIIGNTSGSVPYQIGPEGIIVPEGDINKLGEKVQWVLNHKEDAEQLGLLMNKRAEHYTVQSLNRLFYKTITEDILFGKYDETKADMATYNCY